MNQFIELLLAGIFSLYSPSYLETNASDTTEYLNQVDINSISLSLDGDSIRMGYISPILSGRGDIYFGISSSKESAETSDDSLEARVGNYWCDNKNKCLDTFLSLSDISRLESMFVGGNYSIPIKKDWGFSIGGTYSSKEISKQESHGPIEIIDKENTSDGECHYYYERNKITETTSINSMSLNFYYKFRNSIASVGLFNKEGEGGLGLSASIRFMLGRDSSKDINPISYDNHIVYTTEVQNTKVSGDEIIPPGGNLGGYTCEDTSN